MTCRCTMCGSKNAGTLGRSSYAHANVITSESKSIRGDKRKGRKLRRVRERKLFIEENMMRTRTEKQQ